MHASSGKLFRIVSAATLLAISGCQTSDFSLFEPLKDSSDTGKSGKIARAKETLRQLPTVNDRVAETFYAQGLHFEEQGLIDEAIGQYLHATRLRPSFEHLVYTQLGMLYRQTGQYALARDALKEATTRSPRSAVAHYQLAMVWMEWKQERNLEEASVSLEKVLTINPNLPEAHYHLGKIYWPKDKVLAAKFLRGYLRLGDDQAKIGEVYDMLRQLPLHGLPVATHQTLPAQKAQATF